MKEVEDRLKATAAASVCSAAAHADEIAKSLHPDEAEKAGLITVILSGTVLFF